MPHSLLFPLRLNFILFKHQEELRICVLPTHLSYDAPWPVRKVPLRCTPHFVTYHLESKTYCVITSTAEPLKSYYRFNGEDKVRVKVLYVHLQDM